MRAHVEVSKVARAEYAVEVRFDSEGEERVLTRSMHDPDECEGEVADAMRRLRADELEPGDMALLGRHLFERLLGDECWTELLGARPSRREVLELALCWGAGEHALHRHGWEAMHDGDRFLAEHPDLPVAVTRVVADAEGAECPQRIQAPAKILCGVGVPVHDPEIRAGAEVLGVLRGIGQVGAPVDSKVIDSLTLTALGDACEGFEPDIVHIVSHGRLDEDGRGEIQLADEEDGEVGWVSGEKLLRALGQAERLPSLVLLTGCESAAAGEHMDSLAAELVKGGVPIAIGMSGRISDPVCRLFTRGFATSLSEGKRLVEAMTHGRRAGLQRQAGRAADERAWSMPSIYLAPCVPSDHAPVEVPTGGLAAVIAAYKLLSGPVFCGRKEILDKFDELLDPSSKLEFLVAYATSDAKLGKTRLQHELAEQALRAGHVVVMLDDDADPSSLPHATVPLAAELLEAIVKTRGHFGVEKLFESVLLEELERAVEPIEPSLAELRPEARLTRLRGFLGDCKRADADDDAMAHVLGGALAADLERLLADVREHSSEEVGRLVLILGGIGYWGNGAELLFDRLTGDGPLGDAEPPIPVFATCSFAEDAQEELETALERSHARYWEHWLELEPFAEDEDTLAIQWVLLNPWSDFEYGDAVYAPHPDATGDWFEAFREHFEGVPGDFEDPGFYFVASVLRTSGKLVSAKDHEILEAYARKQR